MAESPLARLLRLKKEKEQANGTAPLETVQGQSSEAGAGTGDSSTRDSAIGRGELLPEETRSEASGLDILVHDVVDSEPSSEHVPAVETVPVAVEQVQVTQSKPMSAMDRLRALKSGGSSNAKQANELVNGSSGQTATNLCDGSDDGNSSSVSAPSDVPELAAPVVPPKPRKTHPIAMEMAELEQALDAQVPGFVSILSQIHKRLRADPDVVTLLDDEEIAVIVAGLEKHTNVTIVAPSAIKAAKSKARKEPVSAMDL